MREIAIVPRPRMLVRRRFDRQGAAMLQEEKLPLPSPGPMAVGDGPMQILAYADSKDFSGAEATFAMLMEGLAARDDVTLSCAAPTENKPLFEVAARWSATGEVITVP